MSELFDDDPRDTPPRSGSGRTRALIITAVALAVMLFLLTTFASLWTDRLWFAQIGYGSVFGKLFWTRTGLFLAFGLVMGGAVAATIMLAYRNRPLTHPTTGDNGLERYRDAVTPIRTWLLVGVSVIAGVFAGRPGQASGAPISSGATVATSVRRTPTSARTSGSTSSTSRGGISS